MRLVGFFLFYCGIKTGKVIVRMCTGRCRQILSIVVPMIFDEVRFCLLNFPHQACRGKLEDKEIFCFQLNFLGKFRRQKRMHG